MKLKILGLLLVLALVVSACGSNDQGNIEGLDPVERDENVTDDDDGYREVDVADNGSDATNDQTDDEVSDGDENATDDHSTTGEESNSDVDSAQDSESQETEDEEPVEEIIEVIQSEYSVLDLSEPEDPTSYTTGLVFIVQEDDLWRVVDRQGKVYRVSSSYDGVAPGIVNNNATVTIDEDGNPSVSLIRDYTTYDQPIILTTTKEEAPQAFAEYLLKAQSQMNGNSAIDSYTINNITTENTLGKGIVDVLIDFNVTVNDVGADSPWNTDEQGNNSNIEYRFSLYGYNETWILPIVEPLYNQIETVNDMNDSDLDSDTTDTETMNGDTDTGNDESRITLANYGNDSLIILRSQLPQSSDLESSGLIDYEAQLAIDKGTEDVVLYEPVKNGVYEVITVYSSKVYLYTMVQPPASETVYTGLAVVDMLEGTYRTLYTGAVDSGNVVGDKFYIFGNDHLFKVDLVNNSLQILSVLDEHLDFGEDSIVVTDINDSVLTATISNNGNSSNYSFDLVTGEMAEIE